MRANMETHAPAAARIGSGRALSVRAVEIVRAIGVNKKQKFWRRATGATKPKESSAGFVFTETGLSITSMKKSVALATEGS